MRKGIVSVVLIAVLSVFMVVPAFAEVSSSDLRHSVVYVEFGLEGDAGYVSFSSGSGFFVGNKDKDPQYFLTNHHVIEDFLYFGKGEKEIANQDNLVKFETWIIPSIAGKPIAKMSKEELQYYAQIAESVWVQFAGYTLSNQITFKAKMRVYFDSDDYEEGFYIDSDSTRDMALLKLAEPTNKRTALAITLPNEEMVGKNVFVVGYPGIADNMYFEAVHQRGENDATVTNGAVSRLFSETGTGRAVIQTNAKIQHGNSGGPMIFENGAVIGINSWSVSNSAELQEVHYALSMQDVVPMLKRNNVEYVELEWPEKKPTPNYLLIGIIAAVVVILAAVVVIFLIKNPPGPEPTPGPVPVPVPDPNDSGYRVQCVSGTLGRKRVMIPQFTKVKMGRGADNGIVFPEDTKGVSKTRCAVWVENDALYIQDLGSTYGTFIEPGTRLNAQETIRIPLDTKFWLGSENECFVIQRKNR